MNVLETFISHSVDLGWGGGRGGVNKSRKCRCERKFVIRHAMSVWKCYIAKKPCLGVFQSSEVREFSHSSQLRMTYVKKIARMCFLLLIF